MDLRTLIILKLKGFSNRKVADYLKVNRKTVDSYTSRFKALGLTYPELLELDEAGPRDLFTENSQTEKARYELLSNQFPLFQKRAAKTRWYFAGALERLL